MRETGVNQRGRKKQEGKYPSIHHTVRAKEGRGRKERRKEGEDISGQETDSERSDYFSTERMSILPQPSTTPEIRATGLMQLACMAEASSPLQGGSP